ncbi:hypothetical protein SAMN03097694_1527 [Janthinobacterium lividum]|uniref:Uncharacterized protein n=1 Tax=Janthinobacterium lividum TaxID=29581 RepID=A0AB38C544_9BURK|nr:hypothetical protein [Janthinobacterium lividum]SFX29942.1 hypothetical protein SAMN03097694_1527 [Janthinobacterium lividum]
MLFDFWRDLSIDDKMHPLDVPLLGQNASVFQTTLPPGHVNGRLKDAPVVACYLNPGYEAEDSELAQSDDAKRALFEQIRGESNFPMQFAGWRKWYLERVGRIDLPPEQLASTVAVFNVLAYASKNSKKVKRSLVKKLPSCIMARRHLHEVLIPEALRGDRFLVIARGAWAWQIDRSIECETIRFAPNPVGGHFGPAIGAEITRWLDFKKLSAR